MDELIKEALRGTGAAGAFGVWDMLVALLLAFFLSLAIAYFYRETHRGLSYSVTFVHTMILMGVTVVSVLLVERIRRRGDGGWI